MILFTSITNKLLCDDQSEETIDLNEDILWRLENLAAPKDMLKLIFVDSTRGRTKKFGYKIDTEPSKLLHFYIIKLINIKRVFFPTLNFYFIAPKQST